MKAQINIENILAYLQGNIRYKLYYSKRWHFLIPLHIREQIETRILSMDVQCYEQGSCKICGCATTNLQMAAKQCDGDCYPKMLNKKDWLYFTKRKFMVIDGVLWKLKYNKFQRVKK